MHMLCKDCEDVENAVIIDNLLISVFLLYDFQIVNFKNYNEGRTYPYVTYLS